MAWANTRRAVFGWLMASLCLAIWGCENSKTSPPKPLPPVEFEVVKFERAKLPPALTGLISSDELQGSTGLRFRDVNGDNVVFFSVTRMGAQGIDMHSVAVSHVIETNGSTKKKMRLVDELNCRTTSIVEFIPSAAKVTDLDGDGIGEFSFAYAKVCGSWQLVAGAAAGGTRGLVSGNEKEPTPKRLRGDNPVLLGTASAVWQKVYEAELQPPK